MTNLLPEEIKDLIGEYEGYKITSHGRVLGKRFGNELSQTFDDSGYSRVKLYSNGVGKHVRVHRLVAEYFIDNPNELPVVNHIDGNKANPYIENLEWSTIKENTRHAVDTGLLDMKGSKHHNASINENQAWEIIGFIKDGLSTTEIVSRLSYATKSIVDKIKYKQRWKHLNW